MAWLARVPGLVLAGLCLLAAAMAPSGARAQDAEQIRTDVAAALASLSAGLVPITYDAVDVAGTEAPFEVTLRGLRLGPDPEAGITLDPVRFRVWPMAGGLYEASDQELPSTITRNGFDGRAEMLMQSSLQGFKAIWSPALGTFLSLDAAFDDLVLRAGGGSGSLTVAELRLHAARTQAAPGRWAQNIDLTVGGFHAVDGDTVVAIGGLEACVHAPAIDLPALWGLLPPAAPLPGDGRPRTPLNTKPAPAATEEPASPGADTAQPATPPAAADTVRCAPAAALEPQTAEVPVPAEPGGTLDSLPAVLGDLTVGLTVRDVFAHGGREIWALQGGSISLALSGLAGEHGRLRLVIDEAGLAGMLSPAYAADTFDLHRLQLLHALVPGRLSLELGLENLPGMGLWRAFIGHMNPAAPAENEDAALGLLVGSAQQLLGAAGASLALKAGAGAKAVQLTLEGQAQADAAARLGATGKVDVSIIGLDEVIKVAKAGADDPRDIAPLELLRAFGERRTEADARIADHYALSLDREGVPSLNGKDFMALFSAMQK